MSVVVEFDLAGDPPGDVCSPGSAAGLAGEVIAAAIAGQSERLDVFQRLRHAPFPGGRLLRTPLLVAAMSWYKLRDALW